MRQPSLLIARFALVLLAALVACAGVTRVDLARASTAPERPSFASAASHGMQDLLEGGPVGWDSTTGLWGGPTPAHWWQSALAVTTMVRYAERVDSTAPIYQRVLMRTYRRNVLHPHAAARRWFADRYMDDTGWWGLAWLNASQYELYDRGDRRAAARFLAVAETDAGYIARQPRPCGGIEWSFGRGPDTVTNAEFIALAAELARQRLSPGPFYSRRAGSMWASDAEAWLTWLEGSGLINLQTGSVLGALNSACRLVGGSLTYSEGEVAEALTQMGNLLGNASYYEQAAAFLGSAINRASGLTSDGILHEHCEVTGTCARVRFRLDLPAFKGLFVNALADWTAATGNDAFDGFLRTQASAVIQNAIRGPYDAATHCATPQTCQFAFHWSSEPDPGPLRITLGGQESALDALTSALPTAADGG